MAHARDTQFAGFAHALLHEMLLQTQWYGMDFTTDDEENSEEYSLIIARRVYDLVQSTCVDVSNSQIKQGVRLPPSAMMRAIADMPELPKETQEEAEE